MIAFFVVGYAVILVAGYWFDEVGAGAWVAPATALVLGTLIRVHRSRWTVFIAAAIGLELLRWGLVEDHSIRSVWSALAPALGAATGALALAVVTGATFRIGRLRHVTALVVCAVLIASPIAASVRWLSGALVWQDLWLAESVAAVIVVPLIVAPEKRPSFERVRTIEMVAIAGCVLALTNAIFASKGDTSGSILGQPYILAPGLLWFAVRSEFVFTAVLDLVFAATAATWTLGGLGPFNGAGVSAATAMTHVQVFITVTSIAALVFSAANAEREEGRRQLGRTLDYLDSVYKSVEAALFVLSADDDGRLRYVGVNPAFEQFTGLTLKAIRGRTTDQMHDAGVLEAVQRSVRAFVGAQPKRSTLTGLHCVPVGTSAEGWFHVKACPVFDETGRLRRIVGAAMDVTDAELAKRDLDAHRRLLEETQRGAQAGGLVHNLLTGDVQLSGPAADLLQLEDRSMSFDALLERRVPKTDREYVRMARLGSDNPRPIAVDFRVALDDGSIRYFREAGEVSGTIARSLIFDETKRFEAEALVEAHRAEITRLDKVMTLGTLVATVAHEVDNPNHFILMNAPVMKRAWRDAVVQLDQLASDGRTFKIAGLPYSEMRGDVATLLDEVTEGAERIRDLVQDLRGFMAFTDSRSVAPLSINDVVTSAFRLVRDTVRRSATSHTLDLDPSLPTIDGQFRRLEQVMVNLIINACDAIEPVGGWIGVTTSVSSDGKMVVVAVKDDGSGIEAQHLSKLTNSFFTTKADGKGTGLGLAVASRIVREHGGKLRFESAKDRGTTVYLEIPVDQAPGGPEQLLSSDQGS